MIALVAHYWYGLLIAIGIGLSTAWWIWGERPAGLSDMPVEFDPDDEPVVEMTTQSPQSNAVETTEPVDAVARETVDVIEVPAPPMTEPVEEAEAYDAIPAEAEAEPIDEKPDDLMVIKGIGPQLDALLRSLGVERFADIANWMPEDIERIDDQLGIYKGRILRDEWIGQARLLAKGDMDNFTQRYGHLS